MSLGLRTCVTSRSAGARQNEASAPRMADRHLVMDSPPHPKQDVRVERIPR